MRSNNLSQHFENTCDHVWSDNTVKNYRRTLKRARNYVIKETKFEGEPDTMTLETVDPEFLKNFVVKESVFADGRLKAASTVESFKNALIYYFRSNKLPIPTVLSEDLQMFITGTKNDIATLRKEGRYKLTEGKDAITFGEFSAICKAGVADKYIAGRLLASLCWNMNCRSETASNLNFNLISWSGDCLNINIPKEKSKQKGADRGVHHIVHIYANPLEPDVCCILALGIYVVCGRMYPRSGRVFEGSNEQEKFSKWLEKKVDSVESLRGREIGTQSFRKGVLSHNLSHSSILSAISALLRGGWSIGGLLPRYIMQLMHADEVIGRTACGIKLGNEFDSLYVDMVSKETAPLFKNIDDLLVELKKKDNICYGALSNACGAYVRAVLEVNEIDQLFNVQLGADEVSAPKPHPDGLLQCCQQLKLPPSQCVYIGDSPTDAEAALFAGMRAIGVTWGSHAADRVLAAFPDVAHTVEELKQKLESIGADKLSCKDDDIV